MVTEAHGVPGRSGAAGRWGVACGSVEEADGASSRPFCLIEVRRVGIAERTADEAVVNGGALDAHTKERTVVRVDHLSMRKAPSGKQPELSWEASGGEDLVFTRDQPQKAGRLGGDRVVIAS